MGFSRRAPLHVFLLCFLMIYCRISKAQVQPKTDPIEVTALNTILNRWGKKASPKWNISGEPCSGVALDATTLETPDLNPFIKCDCSDSNGTICHITALKVYALDVVGTFPNEIQNLTHLKNLKFDQNYLTGPLPPFIGNLTALQYLSFGINALSGTLPKELGKLKNLILLGMGTNNFVGTIPSEIGSLSNLQLWYMDSSGVGGELPSTLSGLKNMQTLWASDNNFTGRIPDFISGWTNLQSLRIQGNSFQGPIPSGFSILANLTDLRIGDLVDGVSTFAFTQNLTSLSTLILRNAKISDIIPSDFSQFKALKLLDLSFNNFTGTLPSSLFNLSSLNILYLGNNSLSGSLPSQKSSSLLTIDLSYNQLSGTFPSWISQQNLQLNLVANNFVIDSSNNSAVPLGLNCLQLGIPCSRGSPIYSNFAINCGGNKSIKSFDGTLYDSDDANLNAASYYLTSTDKWAVSNVGSFADSSTSSYILNTLSQFPNTLDSELFQTSRLSPSSLRYYGIGLENGNYTVKLQFTEIKFTDPPTWRSTGRRVFDIYIQGVLMEKDFDIRKAAGGVSMKAVVQQFTAPVVNNFLEIHFFWAGKGTCCVPDQGYYGSSVSAISVSPYDFIPTVSNISPNSGSKNHASLIAGIVVAVVAVCFLVILGIVWRRRRTNNDDEFLDMDARPDTFSYAELRTATEDFIPANKLGEGGFGPVFKGKLSDGRLIAVKQLSEASHQGKQQFITEIATISAVQHRNLVKLYGCCLEGVKRLVVYEYLENKSLDQALFGKTIKLDWPTRFDIILGTARGLAYLHEESRVRIVHRDVKASNILLDADLKPKISDFGLAKLYDDKKTHISTRVAGTIGYLAPEYAMRGHLTEKADVFSFGVVTLEVICGRPNSDVNLPAEKIYLLGWAWNLHEQQREFEMVDPSLTSYDPIEVSRAIGVALLCSQASPMVRPPMSRVVAMLTGDIEVSEVKSKPGFLNDWQFSDISENFSGVSSDIPRDSRVSMRSGTSAVSEVHSTARPMLHVMEEGR